MSTSVNVNGPSASAKLSTGFLSPQDRTKAEGGTATAIIGLLVAVGLALFAAGGIYLNYLVGPTDLHSSGSSLARTQ